MIGAPFYVMEYVEGTVITSEIPDPLDTPEERRRMGLDLVDALAEVHAVDWRACGLEGFGKPTGYLERQVRRFTGLWEHNKTRELPRVQEVRDWLAANMPDSPEATIVHGDFRLGNTMVANDAPARVIAIFDWELSTIGDPLADLGYLTVTWVQPGDAEDTMFSSLSAVTRGEGFPSRDELIAYYEERTGPLDVGPALVRGAGGLEGGRVHGGQLQALARRHDRRPVPEDVRQGRARARGEGSRDRAWQLRTGG